LQKSTCYILLKCVQATPLYNWVHGRPGEQPGSTTVWVKGEREFENHQRLNVTQK